MNIRFITKTVHAYLDYPVAFSLMATPFALRLGQANPAALWLSVVTGVAALILTVFTNHKTGLIRILPYAFHLWVDRTVGIVFITAPFVLGFTGLAAGYYLVNGVTVLLVTFLLNARESARSGMMEAHA